MNNKIAIFFDTENISASYLHYIFNEIEEIKSGQMLVNQAFRDWSSKGDWSEEIIEDYGIEPIQIFRGTSTNKNTCDLRMQRAILETLQMGAANVYIIVSGDKDFRDIALHVRKFGHKVIGIGKENTTKSLQNVYSEFVFLPRDIKAYNKSIKDSIELENKNDTKASEKPIHIYDKDLQTWNTLESQTNKPQPLDTKTDLEQIESILESSEDSNATDKNDEGEKIESIKPNTPPKTHKEIIEEKINQIKEIIKEMLENGKGIEKEYVPISKLGEVLKKHKLKSKTFNQKSWYNFFQHYKDDFRIEHDKMILIALK